MSTLVIVSRFLLAAVFAASGLAKLVDLRAFRRALGDFAVSARLTLSLAVLLATAELVIAGTLVPQSSARFAGMAALALLGLFVAVISVTLARGRQPECRCFGQLHPAPVGPATLLRNIALAGLAAVVVAQPEGHLGDTGIVALAMAAGLALQAGFSYQLLRQNGRILARLATVEASLGPSTDTRPQGPAEGPANGTPHAVLPLPVGARAPDFSIPSLPGPNLSLSALLRNGRPVLLVFVHPECAPCLALLPRLAEWQRDLAELLTVLVVSEGAAAENRAQVAQHGLERVALQRHREVSELYRAHGTPSAQLVAPDGRVASRLVTGTEDIVSWVSAGVQTGEEPSGRSAAAVAAGTAAAGLTTAAAVAEAADPERESVSTLIAAAEAKLTSDAGLLRNATARYARRVRPRHGARTEFRRALARERSDLGSLRRAIEGSPASAEPAVRARRLVTETLKLLEESLTKLDRASRSHSRRSRLRYVRAGRKLLYKALQSGVDARAALGGP
jgi:thiol-disulfide isomerase/thioredoxin